jgi:hypothetical protein
VGLGFLMPIYLLEMHCWLPPENGRPTFNLSDKSGNVETSSNTGRSIQEAAA